jgi:hypothetical protein
VARRCIDARPSCGEPEDVAHDDRLFGSSSLAATDSIAVSGKPDFALTALRRRELTLSPTRLRRFSPRPDRSSVASSAPSMTAPAPQALSSNQLRRLLRSRPSCLVGDDRETFSDDGGTNSCWKPGRGSSIVRCRRRRQPLHSRGRGRTDEGLALLGKRDPVASVDSRKCPHCSHAISSRKYSLATAALNDDVGAAPCSWRSDIGRNATTAAVRARPGDGAS